MEHHKRYENNRGDYHERKSAEPKFKPLGANEHWPNYQCRNGCGFNVDSDSPINTCPTCHAPLARWFRYEVKGSSSPNSRTPA